MATVNEDVIKQIVYKLSDNIAGKNMSQLGKMGITYANFVPVETNEISRITRRNGYSVYIKALKERDRVERTVQKKLITIAREITDKLHSGNPANNVQKYSTLLRLKSSYINQLGIGRSDTYYYSNILSKSDEEKEAMKRSYITEKQYANPSGTSRWEYGGMAQKTQRRTTYSFQFEISYPRKYMYRRALLGAKKRGGNKAYIPYIVNNTWNRHPRRQYYVRDTKTKQVVKTIKTLPAIDKNYMQKIQAEMQKWVDEKYPEWRVSVKLNSAFGNGR